MIDKIEETVVDKTPRLNKPETYLLTHNRFNTYLVLITTDLNKVQIYEMPFTDNPYHEIKLVISFN